MFYRENPDIYGRLKRIKGYTKGHLDIIPEKYRKRPNGVGITIYGYFVPKYISENHMFHYHIVFYKKVFRVSGNFDRGFSVCVTDATAGDKIGKIGTGIRNLCNVEV